MPLILSIEFVVKIGGHLPYTAGWDTICPFQAEGAATMSQEEPNDKSANKTEEQAKIAKPTLQDQTSETHHEVTINGQLDLDPSLQQNITMNYYQAGHMMYIHDPSLQQLKEDLARFIQSAAS